MSVRAVRGATQLETDTRDHMLDRVAEMVRGVVEANDLDVAVNTMLMKSSTVSSLASNTPRTISATRSSMWSRVSVSSWVAPRTARTDTLTPHVIGWAPP